MILAQVDRGQLIHLIEVILSLAVWRVKRVWTEDQQDDNNDELKLSITGHTPSNVYS